MDTVNRFTDAEMDIVRNTDLPALLTVLGYQVTKIGHYHSTKEMGQTARWAVWAAILVRSTT